MIMVVVAVMMMTRTTILGIVTAAVVEGVTITTTALLKTESCHSGGRRCCQYNSLPGLPHQFSAPTEHSASAAARRLRSRSRCWSCSSATPAAHYRYLGTWEAWRCGTMLPPPPGSQPPAFRCCLSPSWSSRSACSGTSDRCVAFACTARGRSFGNVQ